MSSFHRYIKEDISKEQLTAWNQGITLKINDIILEFTVQNAKAAEKRLDAQQELIVEISFFFTIDIGLLPSLEKSAHIGPMYI